MCLDYIEKGSKGLFQCNFVNELWFKLKSTHKNRICILWTVGHWYKKAFIVSCQLCNSGSRNGMFKTHNILKMYHVDDLTTDYHTFYCNF